jgi:hypothetical protein
MPLSAEGEELAREMGCLLPGFDQAFQVRLSRMVRRQAQPHDIGDANHHRQEIVEVVDRAARQASDQFQALGILQLVLQPPRGGDVGKGGDDPRLLVVKAEGGPDRQRHRVD